MGTAVRNSNTWNEVVEAIGQNVPEGENFSFHDICDITGLPDSTCSGILRQMAFDRMLAYRGPGQYSFKAPTEDDYEALLKSRRRRKSRAKKAVSRAEREEKAIAAARAISSRTLAGAEPGEKVEAQVVYRADDVVGVLVAGELYKLTKATIS